MTPWIWMPLILKPRRAKHCCALLSVAGGPHSSLVRLCVPVCVCKELAKYLELDQHPNSSITGGWAVAQNINMCNCKRIKERQIAHCSMMEATRKPKIEMICWFNRETWIFSLAWMHAMLMWRAQHKLWSRSWPMKSEHLGNPTKETAMKRSLKSTFGCYFIEALLRLMQACALTCGSGLEFQTS